MAESDDEGAATASEDEEMLHEQIADLPFEVLQKARAEGFSGIDRKKDKASMKRANKNRPMEMSSKKPVRVLRDVVQAPKRVIRDPRFESLCGDFEEERFKKSYSFIFDESLPAERQKLYEKLRKEKNPEVIRETKERIAWIGKQLKAELERRKAAEKAGEQRRKERELVKQGKKPYYMKKSDVRKAKLIEKYEDLKAAGKLDAFLEKRRKKNASKDHRYMPYRRTREAEA